MATSRSYGDGLFSKRSEVGLSSMMQPYATSCKWHVRCSQERLSSLEPSLRVSDITYEVELQTRRRSLMRLDILLPGAMPFIESVLCMVSHSPPVLGIRKHLLEQLKIDLRGTGCHVCQNQAPPTDRGCARTASLIHMKRR